MNNPNANRLPPQLVRPDDTASMMFTVIIALIPALCMSIFFFGLRALLLTLVSVASCVGFEALYRRLTHQSRTIEDLSACVTGMLLAMSLPAAAPYWVPVLGAAFGIIVVKQFYGGLGKNFMNPALAGRMLLATFPMLMTTWSAPLDRLPLVGVDVVSSPTPMSFLHEGVLPPNTIGQLLLGQKGGCLGEVSSFMILLGGGYLIFRRIISPRIPVAFLGSVAVVSLLFPHGNNPFAWMMAQLLSGGLLLGAFFLAPDPTTSPITPRGQTIYGICCGLLTMLLRYHSSYPEGVGWAILVMNCCVWLLDRAGTPRRYGQDSFVALGHLLHRIRVSTSKIKFVKPPIPQLKAGMVPGEEHLDQIRTQAKAGAALAAVMAVTVGILFGIHSLTDLDSARNSAAQKQALLQQVMPQAVTRSDTPYRADGALSIAAGYSAENQLVGHCVEVQAQGFGGVITMVVGVDLDGKVTGVAVTDHHETNNVGTKAMTQSALSRYVGRSGTLRTSGVNAVDTVSGATATSKALTTGVNRALAIVANLDFDEMEVTLDGEP